MWYQKGSDRKRKKDIENTGYLLLYSCSPDAFNKIPELLSFSSHKGL